MLLTDLPPELLSRILQESDTPDTTIVYGLENFMHCDDRESVVDFYFRAICTGMLQSDGLTFTCNIEDMRQEYPLDTEVPRDENKLYLGHDGAILATYITDTDLSIGSVHVGQTFPTAVRVGAIRNISRYTHTLVPASKYNCTLFLHKPIDHEGYAVTSTVGFCVSSNEGLRAIACEATYAPPELIVNNMPYDGCESYVALRMSGDQSCSFLQQELQNVAMVYKDGENTFLEMVRCAHRDYFRELKSGTIYNRPSREGMRHRWRLDMNDCATLRLYLH
jgi:hypothetical protein